MNTQAILHYLSALNENNDREWFHAHKEEYREANAQFEEFLQALVCKLGGIDESIVHNSPKDVTFKLVRDTRFSHDKSPYIPAFRAHIGPAGKQPIPVGYYLMIKAGGTFLGGGLFADIFRDATKRIRDYLYENPEEWEGVIANAEFRERFTVRGSALKKIPEGYDGNHPAAEFLKYKSWYLEYPVEDAIVADSEAFLALAADIFRRMKPFNDYLNRALAGFQMPERK